MDVLSDTKKTTCGICDAKESRYTCPKCSIQYCSLACYKSECHADCSEEFYRDCVMTQLESHSSDAAGSTSGGTTGGMNTADVAAYLRAELAKREEDTELFDQDGDEDEDDGAADADQDDDDGPSLEDRFADINIDGADTEAILERLTSAERAEFELLLKDPEKQASLIKLWTPWWQSESMFSLPSCGAMDGDRFAALPAITELTKAKPSEYLPCNLVNILFAYCCSYRLYNGELNTECLLDICHVLSENATYHSVERALLSAVSLCTQSPTLSLSLGFCSVAAQDVHRIVSTATRPVAEVGTVTAPLHALVDVYNSLCMRRDQLKRECDNCSKSDPRRPGLKVRFNRVKRIPEKVYFFLVWAKSAYHEWPMLAESVSMQADDLSRRAADSKQGEAVVKEARTKTYPKPVLIQEAS